MSIYVKLRFKKKKTAFRENVQQEGKKKIQKDNWNFSGYLLGINKVSITEDITKQILK